MTKFENKINERIYKRIDKYLDPSSLKLNDIDNEKIIYSISESPHQYNMAKKIKTENLQPKAKQKNAKIYDDEFLVHFLVLENLNEQIKLIDKKLNANSVKDIQKDKFVAALMNLRDDLKADIEIIGEKKTSKLTNNPSLRLAVKTTEMLKDLLLPGANPSQILRDYEADCKRMPLAQKFVRLIAIAVLAGIAYVAGSRFGLSAKLNQGVSIACALTSGLFLFGNTKYHEQVDSVVKHGFQAYGVKR